MNWDKIKNTVIGVKGLATIGISDIAATGISSIFWFYFASVVETEQFGQIHYFLGIAGISYTIALFGVQSVITIYAAPARRWAHVPPVPVRRVQVVRWVRDLRVLACAAPVDQGTTARVGPTVRALRLLLLP